MTDFTLTEGNDTFPGPRDDVNGSDQIFGLGGDDLIQIGAGVTVYGGDGNDQAYGSSATGLGAPGHQIFYGGSGDDMLAQGFNSKSCEFFGGTGNDTLSVGQGFEADTVLRNFADAGSGDDWVYAAGGAFSVTGGTGQDTLSIALFLPGSLHFDASGPDVIYSVGGESHSVISGFEAYQIQAYRDDDVLVGGALGDELDGDGGNDLLYGGGGNDTLTGETVYGGAGDDFMPGISSTNTLAHALYGGQGDDVMWSGAARLIVDAGAGDDFVGVEFWGLYAGPQVAGTVQGGAGTDLLNLMLIVQRGMLAGDTIEITAVDGHWTGLAGGRTFLTGDGFEALTLTHSDGYFLDLVSGAGNDTVVQQSKSGASLDMGAGDDKVTGGRGQEAMFGGDGNDTLLGGSAKDTLMGGMGRDYLGGGTGQDVLVFGDLAESGTAFGKGVIDQVSYFQHDAAASAHYIDRIDLSAIDAMAGTAGAQDFAFIGTAEFTTEGQVRVVQAGSTTYVQVNGIGSGGSDMTICLLNVVAAQIGAEDFIL